MENRTDGLGPQTDLQPPGREAGAGMALGEEIGGAAGMAPAEEIGSVAPMARTQEIGSGVARTAPARQRTVTGEPRVDAALAGLDELPELPVTEHRAVFELVHRSLSEVLGELDTGLPQAAGGGGHPGNAGHTEHSGGSRTAENRPG